jgi:hypothetical protein
MPAVLIMRDATGENNRGGTVDASAAILEGKPRLVFDFVEDLHELRVVAVGTQIL